MNKFCFLVPYYNHSEDIKKLCEILNSHKIPILIIDDGSDEVSKTALLNLEADILTLPQNMGKGAAMKAGFVWMSQSGFTHAFQIDADIQHDLAMINPMLQRASSEPNALICGYGVYDETIPKSRLYGRKITDFWVWVNTFGGRFKDAMTGMRIYPLNGNLDTIQATKSNRMEFDIEILMNLYKKGLKIIWIPIRVKYGTVSHFRTFRDNVLITKMQARAFFSLPKYIYKRVKNAMV